MDSIDAGIFSEVLSVLIVDGDKAAGSETRATLLLEGIGSDASESGSEAMDMIRLHHARRQDYDLILVDISLPEGSGLSMIQGMRGLMEDSSTVIIVTSGSSLGNVAQAKEAGADASVQVEALQNISAKLAEANAALKVLEEKTAQASEAKASGAKTAKELAFFYKDEVFVAMEALRTPVDALETMVDKAAWPIPTYGELIFEV